MRDRRIKLFHGEEIDGKEVRVYIEICKSAAKLVIFLLISKYKDMIFKNKCINYNNNLYCCQYFLVKFILFRIHLLVFYLYQV